MAEGKSVSELAEERAEPKVAKDLEPLLVPVDELEPHPDNARRGDLDRIAESLERFGQLRPVLVNARDGYIVAGNHVYLSARELGWSHVAAVREDMEPQDAKAYLLADNRLAELGTYDDAALAAVLRDVYEDGSLAATGYPEGGDPLDALLARLNPDGGSEFPVEDPEDESDYRCPGCGYKWSGNPRPEAAPEEE